MKKIYMVPNAETVKLTLEGMVAASSLNIDDSYEGNQNLSDHKESIWGEDSWNEE